MNPTKSNPDGRRLAACLKRLRRLPVFRLILICCWANAGLAAAGPAADLAAYAGDAFADNAAARFNVTGYEVGDNTLLSTNVLIPLFASHAGTNVSVAELVRAASDLHAEFCKRGQPMMSVAIPLEQITNGIVKLNVFPTAVPQVVVSGECYLRFAGAPETAIPEMVVKPTGAPLVSPPAPPATNAVAPVIRLQAGPDSPAQIARARAAMLEKMAELKAREMDTCIHVVSTNSGPRFAVDKYLISGNTVLPPEAMSVVLTNIDGAFGTNVSFEGIHTAVEELQRAYRERGYVTVAVGLPQQKLTNATVKVQVVEGRLAAINVTGNRYFSSENVMRALPSLHPGMLLNGPVFQAELNRANASRDRQIYPVIGPGPDPGTSALTLKVKDNFPLHAKLELNNQNSPGTPDLRANASMVADNLWQREHSLGVQYGFSPEAYKLGSQWDFYDVPLVANYGAFYRLPLGNPEPVEKVIASNPGSFGYNEATRKFNLPPLSGGPDLTLFASRAAIDTGLTTLSSANLYNTNGNSLDLGTVHEDLTVNSDLGSRLSFPLPAADDFHSVLSGGVDYKSYELSSSETNIFTLTTAEINYNTTPPTTNIVVSKDYSPVPFTVKQLDYLPLSLGYNASWHDWLGNAALGLDAGVNLWYSSVTSKAATRTDTNGVVHTSITYLNGVDSLQQITGSKKSTGHWVVLRPSFSQEIVIHTNWIMTFHADGQWASEPLISNEQFGIGGVNSVRGYHEGEVFGDTGWHVSLEQQTPPHLVGVVRGNLPLTIRGSLYMDYATAYLLDPQGRPDHFNLWGTGLGLAASLGSHWQSRFLVSVPLISTALTPSGEPHFNFVLTAQF